MRSRGHMADATHIRRHWCGRWTLTADFVIPENSSGTEVLCLPKCATLQISRRCINSSLFLLCPPAVHGHHENSTDVLICVCLFWGGADISVGRERFCQPAYRAALYVVAQSVDLSVHKHRPYRNPPHYYRVLLVLK